MATKVWIHFGQNSGCYYHRMLLPSRYCWREAREAGVMLYIHQDLPEGKTDAFDVYMMHGVDASRNLALIGRWKRAGRKFIWCVDDDYFNIPEWNPAKPDDNTLGALHMVRSLADEIWCSTQPLADTFSDTTAIVRVLPNLIEITPYAMGTLNMQARSPVKVLWMGSTTHRKDVEILDGVIPRVLKHSPRAVEFVYFGMMPSNRLLQFFLHCGVRHVEPVTFADYFSAFKRNAGHIGLAPLLDDVFNSAKSLLKVQELAVTGHAVIASPYGPYAERMEGVAYAESEDQWVEAILRLIDDEPYRAECSAKSAKEVIRKWNWNVAECRRPWLEAFCSLKKPAPNVSVAV